ncbi:hypothetical protein FQR65_LT00401 [Abscondita terminalis]|nr:hypothetical protein FQR65_LT00401 [Abscondita terminalis]
MKFLVLILMFTLAYAIQVPDHVMDNWESVLRPHVTQCICETGVDEKDALNFLRRKHLPDKACFKCYLKCLYFRANLIDGLGILRKDVILSKVKLLNEKLIDDCELHTQNETDVCQKVYSFVTYGLKKIEEWSEV